MGIPDKITLISELLVMSGVEVRRDIWKEKRKSSYYLLENVPFDPVVLLDAPKSPVLASSVLPVIPASVECVSGEIAPILIKTIYKVVKKMFGEGKGRGELLDEFKTNSKLYGTDLMTANEYIMYLTSAFGPVRGLLFVPCLLQLQTDRVKRRTLLMEASNWRDAYQAKQLTLKDTAPVAQGCLFGLTSLIECYDKQTENGWSPQPVMDTDPESLFGLQSKSFIDRENSEDNLDQSFSGISVSSLLSPKVAQEREANRNGANFSAVAVSESNLPSNDVGPSAMYMNGTFQIVMYGSREQLDEDSGKFYTEYLMKCSWLDSENHVENWVVARRFREYCALDLLLREKYPDYKFPHLPRKKFFGSSMSADFVDKRQHDLGNYIVALVDGLPSIVDDETFDEFLDIKRKVMQRTRVRIQHQAQEHQRDAVENSLKAFTETITETSHVPVSSTELKDLEDTLRSLKIKMQNNDPLNLLLEPSLRSKAMDCINMCPRLRATHSMSSAANLDPEFVTRCQYCERDIERTIARYKASIRRALS